MTNAELARSHPFASGAMPACVADEKLDAFVENTLAKPPFFTRGPGPLASILLPARGGENLMKCAKALSDLAHDKNAFELVVKADNDDPETQKAAHEVSRFCKVKLMVTPRGEGYMQLGDWYNQLAQHAQGDWLIQYNADCTMLTKNWDAILYHAPGQPSPANAFGLCGYRCQIEGRPGSSEFMFIRRTYFDVLGHTNGGTPHIDTETFAILNMMNAVWDAPIRLRHEREGTLERQMKHPGQQTMMFYSEPRKVRARIADCLRLQEWMESQMTIHALCKKDGGKLW
jgi:hypothetical protein